MNQCFSYGSITNTGSRGLISAIAKTKAPPSEHQSLALQVHH